MESSKLKKVYPRSESDADADGQLNKEQRDQKKKQQLFMQQFEKEAQERIHEMESNLEQLLATVDRVFRVEMMKLPPQLQNTLMEDLMREDDAPAGEVTIAVQAQSLEVHQPLTRKSSKKVQMRATPTRKKRMLSVENTPSLLTASKRTAKSRSLAGLSSTTKITRASTSSLKRTRSRVAEVRDPAAVPGSKRSTNAAGLSTSPFVTATIFTSCGEPVCLSDDVKDHIDVDMLDETAVLQMQKLMQLMDYLCNKAKVNNSRRGSDEA